MQRFFGCGHVYLYDKSASYEVKKQSDLAIIMEHFNSYPLKTKKYADFLLFKKALDIVINREHLTMTGLTKLISIRGAINKGLPERLNMAFPNIIPEPRPIIPCANIDSNIPGVKHWLAGFVSGEGCFFIKVCKSKTHKLGQSVALNFLIIQDQIDSELLESFTQILGCGNYSVWEKTGVGTFTVTGFNNILEKVIPFFEEYPILGVKAKDFEDFKEASVLIRSKGHLTQEGLAKILLIKSRMNTKREGATAYEIGGGPVRK